MESNNPSDPGRSTKPKKSKKTTWNSIVKGLLGKSEPKTPHVDMVLGEETNIDLQPNGRGRATTFPPPLDDDPCPRPLRRTKTITSRPVPTARQTVPDFEKLREEHKRKLSAKYFSRQVPSWNVSDVAAWIKKIGFDKYGVELLVKEYCVDGDLLLKLEETNLKDDLGIKNGIHRKLFLRELDSLKKNADYSTADTYGTAELIRAAKRPELMVYAYDLIDIEPQLLANLNDNDIDNHLREKGVKSPIHREALVKVFKKAVTPETSGDDCSDYLSPQISIEECKDAPIYIGFAGEGGMCHSASLIKLQLEIRNFNLIESTNPGLNDHLSGVRGGYDEVDGRQPSLKAVEKSYDESMAKCSHYVIILGEGALDEFSLEKPKEEGKLQSPLYYEIVAALKSTTTTIIPVKMPKFEFPKQESLWPEIKRLPMMNAVNYIHEYQPACLDRIEWFIRGDIFSRDPPTRKGGSVASYPTPSGAATPTLLRSNKPRPTHKSSPDLLALPGEKKPGFFRSCSHSRGHPE